MQTSMTATNPFSGTEQSMNENNLPQNDDESPLFKTDDFRMWCMKVIPCTKRFVHDWTACPFAHESEKAVRRDPRNSGYTGIACPDMKKANTCIRGDRCPYAHNVFEYWLHPTRYRTQLCNDGPHCKRSICFFAHNLDELRVPACKPYISPEALARASLEAIQNNPHPLGERLPLPTLAPNPATVQQQAALAALGGDLSPSSPPFIPPSDATTTMHSGGTSPPVGSIHGFARTSNNAMNTNSMQTIPRLSKDYGPLPRWSDCEVPPTRGSYPSINSFGGQFSMSPPVQSSSLMMETPMTPATSMVYFDASNGSTNTNTQHVFGGAGRGSNNSIGGGGNGGGDYSYNESVDYFSTSSLSPLRLSVDLKSVGGGGAGDDDVINGNGSGEAGAAVRRSFDNSISEAVAVVRRSFDNNDEPVVVRRSFDSNGDPVVVVRRSRDSSDDGIVTSMSNNDDNTTTTINATTTNAPMNSRSSFDRYTQQQPTIPEGELAQSLASLKIALTQQATARTTASNHDVVISTLHQILRDAVSTNNNNPMNSVHQQSTTITTNNNQSPPPARTSAEDLLDSIAGMNINDDDAELSGRESLEVASVGSPAARGNRRRSSDIGGSSSSGSGDIHHFAAAPIYGL